MVKAPINKVTTRSFQGSGAVPTDRRTAERRKMTVNGVGSYGTFAVSGSSGRNVKSGQSVRFNFQAAGEKADNLLAGMKELDTGKKKF